MKDLPERPNLRKISIHDEGDTRHVTTRLQDAEQEEQDKHLRYETKNRANTSDNTIYNQTLEPFSTISFFEQTADCIWNTADNVHKPLDLVLQNQLLTMLQLRLSDHHKKK